MAQKPAQEGDEQPDIQLARTLSPEARKRESKKHDQSRFARHIGPDTRFFQIVKRVIIGTWNDGFIHAGNLAYMSLLAMFPFLIIGAAAVSAIGEPGEKAAMIHAAVAPLPQAVRDVLEPVALSVVEARTGSLLWVGGLIGLWTTSSLVETIRDLLRRAYGTPHTVAAWKSRLFSTAFIMLLVFLLMFSLIAQVIIGALQEAIYAWLPSLPAALAGLSISRLVAGVGLSIVIYLLFLFLTPAPYRGRQYPKWPGALFVTFWWMSVSLALPPILRRFFTYDLTYGSLAGIMMTLFFFWLIGIGIEIGAELNAALAEPEDRDDTAADTCNTVQETIEEATQ
ncbi:MAG: YihY/virulence factor BrkB family protein [Sphingomonadaceae bacterium]